jgi:hypothetical protein
MPTHPYCLQDSLDGLSAGGYSPFLMDFLHHLLELSGVLLYPNPNLLDLFCIEWAFASLSGSIVQAQHTLHFPVVEPVIQRLTTHAENLHQLSNAIVLTAQQNAMGALPHLMMAALPIQALQ